MKNKYFTYILAFAFLCLLNAFANPVFSQVKSQSGILKVSPNSEPNYNLHDGKSNSNRSFLVEIKFKKSFASAPNVIVSASSVDCAEETGLRYRLTPKFQTAGGFAIEIATWGDTNIWSMELSWLAVASD